MNSIGLKKRESLLPFILFLFIILGLTQPATGYGNQGQAFFQLDLDSLYLQKDDFKKLFDTLDILRNSFPEDYDIRTFIAIAQYYNKKYSKALKQFIDIETLFNIDKVNDPSSILTKILTKNGKTLSPENAGILYFGKAVCRFMMKAPLISVIPDIKRAAVWGYSPPHSHSLLIFCYLLTGNVREAEKEFKNHKMKKEREAEDYFLQAYIEGIKGNHENAMDLYSKVIEMNPLLSEAQTNLAYHLIQAGKKEEAAKIRKKVTSPALLTGERWARIPITTEIDYETYFESRSLDKFKKYSNLRLREAAVFLNEKALYILQQTGSFKRITDILTLAHYIDPMAFFVSSNLGMAYQNIADLIKQPEEISLKETILNKALNFATQSIMVQPDHIEGYDLLANVYFRLKRYEEALWSAQKIIEIDRTYSHAYYNMGVIYWELQDLPNAERAWQKVIQCEALDFKKNQAGKDIEDEKIMTVLVRPKSYTYRAHLNLGDLYARQNFIEKATEEYEKAIKREPRSTEAYFKIGHHYAKLNIPDKARYYLQKYLNLGGSKKKKAENLLENLKSD